MPRRNIVLAGVAALVAAALVVVLLLRGGGDDHGARPADPLAEALGYAPVSAPLVAVIDASADAQQGRALRDLGRTFPIARFGADSLRAAVRSLGLDPDSDVEPLLGGPLVVAGGEPALTAFERSLATLSPDLTTLLEAGAIAAVAGRGAGDVSEVFDRAVANGRLREIHPAGAPANTRFVALPDRAAVLAARGADVVLGRDAPRVIAAIALRDRQGGVTRDLFERRLGPLARTPALVRAFADPRLLLAPRAHGVPFVDALRGGAFALRLEPDGLRLRAHLPTDPRRLRAADLPLAPGAQPPSPAPGASRVSAGVRGLGQTIRVIDASRDQLRLPFLQPVTKVLDQLDAIKGPLKRFGRIDVDAALTDRLTGTTTITQEPGGVAFRAQLDDGGPLRTALKRIAAIPDFAISVTHLTDLDLDNAGADAFELRRDGATFLKLAVLQNTLVATTDLNASLRAIAARRDELVSRPGALAFHADAGALQDVLVRRLGLPDLARLVLGGIGNLDGSARAELSGVDLDALLQLEH